MRFSINKNSRNANDLVRRIGYVPLGFTPDGELNCVHRISGDYPRFHIYLKEDETVYRFSIHLDQKKPVYEGTTAHSGEYDSEVVKGEVERIKEILYED